MADIIYQKLRVEVMEHSISASPEESIHASVGAGGGGGGGQNFSHRFICLVVCQGHPYMAAAGRFSSNSLVITLPTQFRPPTCTWTGVNISRSTTLNEIPYP